MLSSLPRLTRILTLFAVALTVTACGQPITIATWMEVDPSRSQIVAEMNGVESVLALEGAIFTKIRLDLSDPFNITGTIDVDQVRLGGTGNPFGQLCIRKDLANATQGSIEITVLTGEQNIEFPFAVIASSSFLEMLGLGEITAFAEPPPGSIQFPIDLDVFAPLFETGSIDGVLEMPITMEQDFMLTPEVAVPTTIQLTLVSASKPPVASPAIASFCEPRWALQGTEVDYLVNPKSSYLHQVNEVLRDPLIIDLAEVGALPGDVLRLDAKGEWLGLFQAHQTRVAAVFSTTDTVIPPVVKPTGWNFYNTFYRNTSRVPHAIEAGSNVLTPWTFAWWNKTDIWEDFEITGGVDVVVPVGANYVIVTPIDIAFQDNLSTDLRVAVDVNPAP